MKVIAWCEAEKKPTKRQFCGQVNPLQGKGIVMKFYFRDYQKEVKEKDMSSKRRVHAVLQLGGQVLRFVGSLEDFRAFCQGIAQKQREGVVQ